jgi:anti-anti-sigma factor
MRVRIAWVDFDARTATVVVEPFPSRMRAETVNDMVRALSAAGIGDMNVWLDTRLDDDTIKAVGRTLEAANVTVRNARHTDLLEVKGNCVFQRWDGSGSGLLGPVYQACFETLENVVGRAATFMTLVRLAAEMDPALVGRLRFAVHELVTNAVDHATFEANPRIELSVAANNARVLIVYRDNARSFPTTSPPEVDIARKIARGERRGLGLFILNRMAQELHHRRDGAWNESTVSFFATHSSQPRSSVMDEFKLEQVPCQLPNTVVLRPIGSIESSSVHVLEAKLSALASRSAMQLVIDMSSVTFLSSAGVGAFLGTVSQLRSQGGDLIFMNPAAIVSEVFDIINLSAFFRTIASLDELQSSVPR